MDASRQDNRRKFRVDGHLSRADPLAVDKARNINGKERIARKERKDRDVRSAWNLQQGDRHSRLKMFSIRLRNNIPKAADVVPEAAVILPPSVIPDSLHLPTPYADIHRQQLTMEYKFLALNH